LLHRMQSNPRKGAITTHTYQFYPLAIEVFDCFHKHVTPHSSILYLGNLSIWLFTQTCKCVFTCLCQCHLELERDIRLSSFYLGHFSSSESFDHITNDVNVFHLKSNDSYRLNYFLTFTPTKHTFHHHGWPIASCWFLTYKYGRPFTNGVHCGHT